MIDFIRNWGGVVVIFTFTCVLVKCSVERKFNEPTQYEAYLIESKKQAMKMNFRTQCIETIDKVVSLLPPDAPLRDVQAHIRNAGPQDYHSSEFRIYHEVAKKKLAQIQTDRQLAKGGGRSLFSSRRK